MEENGRAGCELADVIVLFLKEEGKTAGQILDHISKQGAKHNIRDEKELEIFLLSSSAPISFDGSHFYSQKWLNLKIDNLLSTSSFSQLHQCRNLKHGVKIKPVYEQLRREVGPFLPPELQTVFSLKNHFRTLPGYDIIEDRILPLEGSVVEENLCKDVPDKTGTHEVGSTHSHSLVNVKEEKRQAQDANELLSGNSKSAVIPNPDALINHSLTKKLDKNICIS